MLNKTRKISSLFNKKAKTANMTDGYKFFFKGLSEANR